MHVLFYGMAEGTSKQVIMAFCEDEEVDAGIMGDEMGLGKTIQLIAFLAGLAHSGMYRTSLVIAPVTTLRHWQRELRQWHPQFRVIVLHNSSRSRNGTLNLPKPSIAFQNLPLWVTLFHSVLMVFSQ